jgi:hypothetical protein
LKATERKTSFAFSGVVTQITAALSSGLVSTACERFLATKLNGFSLELLTITVEIKCDEPSATTCKHDKRGINVASVRPVQARFPFPCFWQHYLNFDTSSSFLRRILGFTSAPSLTTDKNTADEGKNPLRK